MLCKYCNLLLRGAKKHTEKLSLEPTQTAIVTLQDFDGSDNFQRVFESLPSRLLPEDKHY